MTLLHLTNTIRNKIFKAFYLFQCLLMDQWYFINKKLVVDNHKDRNYIPHLTKCKIKIIILENSFLLRSYFINKMNNFQLLKISFKNKLKLKSFTEESKSNWWIILEISIKIWDLMIREAKRKTCLIIKWLI